MFVGCEVERWSGVSVMWRKGVEGSGLGLVVVVALGNGEQEGRASK